MISPRNIVFTLICSCWMPLYLHARELSSSDNHDTGTAVTKMEAIDFLFKHMPAEDKINLENNQFEKNLRYAFIAKNKFPWGQKIPKKIFLNDVLPYATLNERRDDWREDFYQRFAPIVKNAKTVEQAVECISKKIESELGVKYSTKRSKPDQSPYESMESGLASCTGLSILLVNACRSVGIPARIVGTPSWTTKHGNHNWVEIYTPSDKSWHFTEYYRDAKGLDAGWFVRDAQQANPRSKYHKIYASSWRKTDLHFPLVWDMKNTSVFAIDVTERYIKLNGGIDLKVNSCEIRVEFLKNNKRIEKNIVLRQGNVILFKGTSPKQTDDSNKFLTFDVQKGQIYHLSWSNKAGEMVSKEVKTPSDKDHLQLSLKMGD